MSIFKEMLSNLSWEIKEKESLLESQEPCVGVFWIMNDEILSDITPTSLSTKQGNFEVHDRNHYDIWKVLQNYDPDLKKLKYDYYPRGRIVCDTTDYVYHILLDKCIGGSWYQKIKNHFNLHKQKVGFHTDEPHYTCKDCS
jgi:hypothetical protein